jgi:hypothetical protein
VTGPVLARAMGGRHGGKIVLNEIVDRLTMAVTAQNFLAKITSACSVIIVAIFDPDRILRYHVVGCCDLQHDEYCVGDDPAEWGCAGIWCWTCGTYRTTPKCHIYMCYECYDKIPLRDIDPRSGATHHRIKCSKAVNTRQSC